MTIKISIDEYLAEYLSGKYSDGGSSVLSLPDSSDLYYVLWDLLSKRPVSAILDHGNIEISLPNRRDGKNPLYYNYLSTSGLLFFTRRVKTMFDADFHAAMDEYRNLGYQYIDSIERFCLKYSICSIDEDTLKKNYYRWRNRVTSRNYRRKYKIPQKKTTT